MSVSNAGQPLFTDDAAVVQSKTCQVESWVSAAHDASAYWLLPACNFTGNVELTAGGARVHPDDGAGSGLIQLQAKTVVSPRREDRWAFGGVAGAIRDTGAAPGGSAYQTYYAKAVTSVFPSEPLEIDLNIGAANTLHLGTFPILGAALQYAIGTRTALLAETFRDSPGRGKYQVGARYSIVPARLDGFVSYGNRYGSPGEWSVVAGIRVNSAQFLP